jgi:hypothetical protein
LNSLESFESELFSNGVLTGDSPQHVISGCAGNRLEASYRD